MLHLQLTLLSSLLFFLQFPDSTVADALSYSYLYCWQSYAVSLVKPHNRAFNRPLRDDDIFLPSLLGVQYELRHAELRHLQHFRLPWRGDPDQWLHTLMRGCSVHPFVHIWWGTSGVESIWLWSPGWLLHLVHVLRVSHVRHHRAVSDVRTSRRLHHYHSMRR